MLYIFQNSNLFYCFTVWEIVFCLLKYITITKLKLRVEDMYSISSWDLDELNWLWWSCHYCSEIHMSTHTHTKKKLFSKWRPGDNNILCYHKCMWYAHVSNCLENFKCYQQYILVFIVTCFYYHIQSKLHSPFDWG